MKNKDVLIVTGGNVDLDLLKGLIRNEGQFIVGVDKGLEALFELNIKPDFVIGDFDSANEGIRAMYANSSDAVFLNPMKDFTDTHASINYVLEREPGSITIVGGTGTRLDHTMANIGMLYHCLKKGVPACIIDSNNRIQMTDSSLILRKKSVYGKYISCIPFSDKVLGLTIKGFVYDVNNFDMVKEDSIGVSNELREEEGFITVKSGTLIVMETRD